MHVGDNFTMALAVACCAYTASAAAEYWLLNWLDSLYDIRLPILSALIQNASWPLQGLIYYYERQKHEAVQGKRIVTRQMYQGYCVIGTLNSFISLTRMIGLTSLPPTIYVIAANTEIVFEAILTRLYLGREVSYLQITAVCFVILGVMVSLYNPTTNTYGENENVSQAALIGGLAVSILSRFASSVNTVLADK